MVIFRIIGAVADDHECAQFIAAETYAITNGTLNALLSRFATAAEIPSGLKISDAEPGGWHGAEQAIDQAMQRGDWPTLLELCPAYIGRVNRFCETWVQRLINEGGMNATTNQ